MRLWLRLNGQDISKETREKVNKLIAYNSHTLKYYPTAKREKLLITDAQVNAVVASHWRPALAQARSRPMKAIQMLSSHTVTLCLSLWGIRACSWVDERYRTKGTEGRYLRWHHVTLRFLGYDADNNPLFLLIGSISGAKHAAGRGDEQPIPFRASSGRVEASRDVVLAFVALAVLQDVMGPELRDIIEACEVGKRLLSQNSSYDFNCLTEHDNAPVFLHQVRDVKDRTNHKHPLDKPVPAFAALFQPMTTRHFSQLLENAGFAAGFQEAIGTAIFRRTWCINAQTAGEMRPHEIALEMGQRPENTHLQNVVYRPDHLPQDATARFGGAHESATVAASLAAIGSVNERPNVAEISEAQLEQIEQLAMYVANT